MAGGSDKVQERMDSVVSESRITLDTRLFGKNVIILSLEVANNLRETRGEDTVSLALGLVGGTST